MPSKDKPNFRDLIYWGILLLTSGFSVGGTYALVNMAEKKLDKHDIKIEALEKENARQNTDIEILDVRLKHFARKDK